MQTLSYGYKNPENTDYGAVWFPALNFNIVRLNSHNHDGVNSPFLAPSSVTKPTSVILAAAWVAVAGQTGTYRQSVAVPAGVAEISNYFIQFYITSNGYRLDPTVERIDATHFYVYVNDNTLAITALYV